MMWKKIYVYSTLRKGFCIFLIFTLVNLMLLSQDLMHLKNIFHMPKKAMSGLGKNQTAANFAGDVGSS